MRILIVTAGSRGDVAPFTGLGRRLLEAGHEVAVAAHPLFATLVEGCGLDYRPLPGDPRELIAARGRAGSPQEVLAVMTEFMDGLADGVVAAADGSDLLLTAFGPSTLSRVAGELYGVPVLGTYLVPAFATREFPLAGAQCVGDLGPEGNLEAGQAMLRGGHALLGGVAARLRERLGLPAALDPEPLGHNGCVLHGFSPLVVPRPADWPSEAEVAGYWWPARPQGWQPPRELVDFLDSGPAPVFIGFGSMAPGEGERLGELVFAAVRQAGVRAVVQAGWAGLAGAEDDVMAVGDLPHDWLFPRTAAVVHHAGAGTTAAGLRAGIPAVAVPVMADQPFWAERLHRLGIAPTPVPFADLTAERLAAAITATSAERLRHRAADLSRQIAAEDGARAVLTHIDREFGR